jgi:hypothetical protein
VKNIMKRLSLEELKAKAGLNVVTKLETIGGGVAIDLPPGFPKPISCDNA